MALERDIVMFVPLYSLQYASKDVHGNLDRYHTVCYAYGNKTEADLVDQQRCSFGLSNKRKTR